MTGVSGRPNLHHPDSADGENNGQQRPVIIANSCALFHGFTATGAVATGVVAAATGSGLVGTPSSATGAGLEACVDCCAAKDGGMPGTACVVSSCGGTLPCFLS